MRFTLRTLLTLTASSLALSACTQPSPSTPTASPPCHEDSQGGPAACVIGPPPATSTPALDAAVPASPSAAEPAEAVPVQIAGAESLTLQGVFYAPSSSPAPGILFLHMYGGNKSDWHDLARRLQSAGFACLAIDLRGHGETAGVEDWGLAQEDVGLARAWLASREGVDPQRTAVVGASIGANLALLLGALDPQVAAIALLSPGFDYFRVRTEGQMTRFGNRPAFLTASEDDGYSAETVSALASQAMGPVELIVYAGGAHGTDLLTADTDLSDRLLAFFQFHLAP